MQLYNLDMRFTETYLSFFFGYLGLAHAGGLTPDVKYAQLVIIARTLGFRTSLTCHNHARERLSCSEIYGHDPQATVYMWCSASSKP